MLGHSRGRVGAAQGNCVCRQRRPATASQTQHIHEGIDFIGGRGRNRTYNLSVKRAITNVISTTYAERLAA